MITVGIFYNYVCEECGFSTSAHIDHSSKKKENSFCNICNKYTKFKRAKKWITKWGYWQEGSPQ